MEKGREKYREKGELNQPQLEKQSNTDREIQRDRDWKRNTERGGEIHRESLTRDRDGKRNTEREMHLRLYALIPSNRIKGWLSSNRW